MLYECGNLQESTYGRQSTSVGLHRKYGPCSLAARLLVLPPFPSSLAGTFHVQRPVSAEGSTEAFQVSFLCPFRWSHPAAGKLTPSDQSSQCAHIYCPPSCVISPDRGVEGMPTAFLASFLPAL